MSEKSLAPTLQNIAEMLQIKTYHLKAHADPVIPLAGMLSISVKVFVLFD